MRKIFLILLVLFSLQIVSAYEIGEKLQFEVKYGLIPAGHASLTASDTSYFQKPAIKVTSLAKTNKFFDNIYKVRDEITSVFAQNSQYSYKFWKRLQEGSYRQNRIHLYYPELNYTMYMKYSYKKRKFNNTKLEIPENTHDILSAFYWFRTQEFAVGDTLKINVAVDGSSYKALVLVQDLENIETDFGELECFKIEPKLEGEAIFKQTGNIYIWLTNDEYKIPMLLESKIIFGHFRAILRDGEKIPYQKK
ncbi:MAG TPA: hypothetical protein DHM37_05380 [Candidatus Cloacimonas sp.]|jgi:hypothetical protein|nr:hypothetical protein [Candidatus Cloacimonadota bacterium]HCX73131.1 hypothetical protein [Candidatus Cloacimonas sp.]